MIVDWIVKLVCALNSRVNFTSTPQKLSYVLIDNNIGRALTERTI